MKGLLFLTLGMFTVGSSSFMIAGLLPEIAQTITQPIAIAGQGITAFSLTYLFSAPFFSMFFAHKSAKLMIQIALGVFILGNLITLSSEAIGTFLLGRILTGLGAGIFNPICVSIAMNLGGESSKGKVLSLVWGANSAGAVFGVPFGVYLASKFSWQLSIAYVFFLALISLIGFSFQKANVDFPTTSSLKERLRLLIDKKILSIITITCFTSMASLGLYSYVALLHSGAPYSLTMALFSWGLGGFVGSSTVGLLIDRTKRPKAVMAFVLIGLMLTIITIPYTKNFPYLGLFSFFMWGAFGWATPTPQQHVLFEIYEKQKALLSALNSSAIGLGSSLGTAISGILIASGINEVNLSFVSGGLLFGVIICQIILMTRFKPAGIIVYE